MKILDNKTKITLKLKFGRRKAHYHSQIQKIIGTLLRHAEIRQKICCFSFRVFFTVFIQLYYVLYDSK